MQLSRHRNFKKQYKKLPQNVKEKCAERFGLFMNDPYHPTLHNHAFTGALSRYRSIAITGDIRAWYESNDDVVTFVKIGSHSQLYG